MASTHDLDELLANAHFHKLVADVLAVVAKAQAHPDTTANMANDVLTFVNAMIAEANPHNAGPVGLEVAHVGLSDDALAMLQMLRDQTNTTGTPMLFTITPPPSVN